MIRLPWKQRSSRSKACKQAKSLLETLGGRSIVMVGLMGCGKSSVGRRLAVRLKLPFVDADDEIEKAAGKTVEEIFADHGEAAFREGERKVIERLLGEAPQVLATGGGAFMDAQTRKNIAESGVSIWLKADLHLLMQRVMKRTQRPLLKTADPEAVMRDLIKLRYPLYAKADLIIESRNVSHDVVVDGILRALADGPLARTG